MPSWFRGAKGQAVIIGVVVAVATATLSVSRHLLPGAFNDDGAYLALGRALASGAGYRSTYLVGAPLQVKFPPGFPALIAILWRVGRTPGAVQTMATVINILACGAAAALFFWIGRVRMQMPAAVAAAFVALPFLLDPSVQYFTLVLSEPLFLLATGVALVLADRRDGRTDANSIALGTTLAIAVFLRTQGIALVGAILVSLLFDKTRRRELAIVATASLVPIAAWQAYLAVVSRHETLATQASESSYVNFLAGGGASFVSREREVITQNTLDYLHLFGGYVSGSPTLGFVIACALAVAAIFGAIALARVSRALSFALIANGAMLLAWPAYQDRYLLPLLPLAGLAVGFIVHAGVARIAGDARRENAVRWESVLAAVGLALVLLRQHDIRREVEVARTTGKAPSVSTPSFWLQGNAWFVDATARWAIHSTARTDRIAVVSPAGLWLYSGRQTVPMEVVEPRGAPSVFDVPGRYLASQLVSAKVTIVLVESPQSITAREVVAIRRACPNALQKIDEFSGISAWRAAPSDACIIAFNDQLRTGRVAGKS